MVECFPFWLVANREISSRRLFPIRSISATDNNNNGNDNDDDDRNTATAWERKQVH